MSSPKTTLPSIVIPIVPSDTTILTSFVRTEENGIETYRYHFNELISYSCTLQHFLDSLSLGFFSQIPLLPQKYKTQLSTIPNLPFIYQLPEDFSINHFSSSDKTLVPIDGFILCPVIKCKFLSSNNSEFLSHLSKHIYSGFIITMKFHKGEVMAFRWTEAFLIETFGMTSFSNSSGPLKKSVDTPNTFTKILRCRGPKHYYAREFNNEIKKWTKINPMRCSAYAFISRTKNIFRKIVISLVHNHSPYISDCFPKLLKSPIEELAQTYRYLSTKYAIQIIRKQLLEKGVSELVVHSKISPEYLTNLLNNTPLKPGCDTTYAQCRQSINDKTNESIQFNNSNPTSILRPTFHILLEPTTLEKENKTKKLKINTRSTEYSNEKSSKAFAFAFASPEII